MNQAFVELVRSMLHRMKLGKEFRAKAFNVATFVRNRVTSLKFRSRTTMHDVFF